MTGRKDLENQKMNDAYSASVNKLSQQLSDSPQFSSHYHLAQRISLAQNSRNNLNNLNRIKQLLQSSPSQASRYKTK